MRHPDSEHNVWWGPVNFPLDEKAFMVNRVADFGFLLGILFLWNISSPLISDRTVHFQTLAERRVPTALPAILRRLETEQDSFVRDVIVRALRRLEEGA